MQGKNGKLNSKESIDLPFVVFALFYVV